jgi:hypothetical protein
MVALLRRAVLLGFFAACLACGDGATVPTRPVVPPPAPPLPPLSGASTTYSFSEPLENFGSRRVSVITEHSSFVLYESGGFYLRYEAFEQPYRGTYERDGGQITFHFSERGTTVDAIGTVKADLLEVRYSDMMQHADFENAVYKRVE